MSKSIAQKHLEDFDKQRQTLIDIINKNKEVDDDIVENLMESDFSLLEEHIELTKVLVSAVKELSELYKNKPKEEERPQSIDLKELSKLAKEVA